MRAMKVAIADGDEVFRRALVDVLATDSRFCLAGVAATAEGIVGVVAATQPDLVLLDVRLSGGGGAVTRAIGWLSPSDDVGGRQGPAVIALASQATRSTVETILQAGARGFILKGRIGADLADLLMRCAAGEVVLAVPEAEQIRVEPWIKRGESAYKEG